MENQEEKKTNINIPSYNCSLTRMKGIFFEVNKWFVKKRKTNRNGKKKHEISEGVIIVKVGVL